jgi:hypothetical protein
LRKPGASSTRSMAGLGVKHRSIWVILDAWHEMLDA